MYQDYQNEIRDELMGKDSPFSTNQVQVIVHYGVSNRGKDLDNLNKPLLDTLQKVYEDFNDNKVYALTGFKYKVDKGEEYIDITIMELADG